MKLFFSFSTFLLFLNNPTTVASSASASPRPPKAHELSTSSYQYTFDQYIIDFQKLYGNSDEYKIRKEIFETNLKHILNHNKNVSYDIETGHPRKNNDNGNGNDNGHSFHMGVNHLTDLTEEELKSYFLGYDKSLHASYSTTGSSTTSTSRKLSSTSTTPNRKMDLPFNITDIESLPTSISYKSKTPIKNQGQCGSCWAFSSIAALEGHLALQTGIVDILSPQELISCVDNPNHCGGNGGCTGATAELAFEYIANNGILKEESLPYKADDKITCPLGSDGHDHDARNGNGAMGIDSFTTMLRHKNLNKKNHNKKQQNNDQVVAKVEGYANVPTNNYKALMNAVAKGGPVVIAAAAMTWFSYEGGVYTPPDTTKAGVWDLDHGIVVEGYGTDDVTGEDYWLVRNSWGAQWGEDGYIRLKRVDPDTLDDPDSDCGFDETPLDGIGCELNPDGSKIAPQKVKVCGTTGMLFDPVLPVGVYRV
jgi:cathepsin L